MKKYLLTLALTMLAGCSGDMGAPNEELGSTQQAVGLCVVAEVSGSAGVAPASATGFITSIVGSGTNLQVTYTPSPGSPVVSTIALGAEGGTVTGSWSGAKITSIQPVGNVLQINGANALTFSSSFTFATLTSWAGATGGVTMISPSPVEVAGKRRSIRFIGRDNGASKAADKTITSTCTQSLDYTYNSNNDYVVTVTAPDATSVELFWGVGSLGVDSSPPFVTTVTSGGPGSLTARVTYPGGGVITHSPLRIPQKPSVSAGAGTSCASFAGRLYCFGRGAYGALGNGGTSDSNVPVQAGTSVNIAKVRMHIAGGCWLDAGSNQMVSCWGRNLYGITGLDPAVSTQSTSPVVITGSNQGVTDIAVGDYHACLLRNTGEVNCWGRGTNGQLGNGGTSSSYTFVTPSFPPLTSIAKIAAGGDTTCAIQTNGDLWCWGRDDYGQVGNGGSGVSAITTPTLLLPDIVDVTVGYRHTCAYNTFGNIYCWGRNSAGQLMQGSADSLDHVSPALATLTSGSITGIFSGRNLNTCILQSGVLKCVGENTLGEMGNNTTSAYELALTTPTGFTSVLGDCSIGGGQALGFRAGHVYAWGDNSFGQVGNAGASNPQLTPIQVTGL